MRKYILSLATAIGITAMATTAMAAPLPAGTKLTIEKTTDAAFVAPLPGCTNGSCFGMFLWAGLYTWIPLGPGTDGGIIIGKGQKSGEQETNPYSLNTGELTEAWSWGGYPGTFFTAPSDAGNLFDDTSCTGAGCIGKTELKVWNSAWGGQNIPVGSAAGCNKTLLPACTADQVAGIFVKTWTIDSATTVPRTYRLTYSQVVPSAFTNYPFELILRGAVGGGDSCYLAPIVVTPTNAVVVSGVPFQFTVNTCIVNPTCRVGTPPPNGIIQIDFGCSKVTYVSDMGFVGTNMFTIIVNDGKADYSSSPINVAVIAPTPTPTPQNQPPIVAVSPASFTCSNGAPMPFTIAVTDPDGPAAPGCRVGTSPANGVVTLNGCISGTYTPDIGFVGKNNFSIIANDGLNDGIPFWVSISVGPCTPTSTPTPTGTPTNTPTSTPTNTPTPMGCPDIYPVSQATLTGKQGHLSITVTGNLVSVNPNGKEIKICPTTTATYQASTNTPGATVVCQIKSNTGRGQGNVKVNDHIKCTDKPVGNDKLYIKIKSGVYRKAT